MEITVEKLSDVLSNLFVNPVWLEDFNTEMSIIIKDNIKDEVAWTTNLKDNIDTKVDETGITVVMPDYAFFVDAGRRPGKQPPFQVIEKWCAAKGIDTKFAYPIARNIGERGIEARPFIQKSLNIDYEEKVIDFLEKKIKKLI